MLYFGDLSLQKLIAGETRQWSGRTVFLTEREADVAFWVRLAFASIKDASAPYKQFVGGGGLQSAEPISAFLVRDSVFSVSRTAP